jgi:EAL domain-containing protein (putative c-di-GMP-specific phosphodiesterase class I)
MKSVHALVVHPPPGETIASLPGTDRLTRFFPALLVLTILAAMLEAAASVLVRAPALAAAAGSTSLFAAGIVVTGHQIRLGHRAGARIALAVSLGAFGAVGAYLIPGVGPATALLPILSIVLVLPHMPRQQLVLVTSAAVASSIAILILAQADHHFPAIDGIAGTIFQDSIVIGVTILIVAALADFAMEARDALANLRVSTDRQMRVTAARLAIVAGLRNLHALPTPEATAGLIASALSDLPLVDIAVVMEASDDGLAVLASTGEGLNPIHAYDNVPAIRAAYLLERSRIGAWAELWVDRPGPGLEDARLTELGIKGQAFAPIVADDEIVGLIGIATRDEQQARHLVADLPSVSEAATVGSAILAPALLARRQRRSASLRIAKTIGSGAFQPVFQPIVDLHTGKTVGFEALTRFASGDAPDRVFSDAADVGLGPELEAATLAAALRDAVGLPAGAWLSLNVSPTFLAQSTRLSELLAVRTRPIVLEITEHEMIDDYAPLHLAMSRLGGDVGLAVDDAGAGIANFRHLVELRPNLVKIDASLIRGANADVSRQALIVGLVHFAEVSGAQVLAEGLETDAEQATVQRLGVTLGQGFLLGRPGLIDEWLPPTRVLRRASVAIRPPQEVNSHRRHPANRSTPDRELPAARRRARESEPAQEAARRPGRTAPGYAPRARTTAPSLDATRVAANRCASAVVTHAAPTARLAVAARFERHERSARAARANWPRQPPQARRSLPRSVRG